MASALTTTPEPMRTRNIPAALLLVICLASDAAWSQPLPAAPAETYFGGLLQVQAPPGWVAVQAADAVTFRPEQGDAAPIEIVSWEMPRGGEPSARAAAAAHESLLFERAPYRRLGANPVRAGSGQEGLLVTGRLLGQDGRPHRTAFAAFAGYKRYWIVATFPDDGGPEASVPQALRDLLGGLRFLVPTPVALGPAPAPQPLPAEPGGTAVAVVPGPAPAAPQPPPLAPPSQTVLLSPPQPTTGAPQPSLVKPGEPAPVAPPQVAAGVAATPTLPTGPATVQSPQAPGQPLATPVTVTSGPPPRSPQPPPLPPAVEPTLAPPGPPTSRPQPPTGLKPSEPAPTVPSAAGPQLTALPLPAAPAPTPPRPTTTAPEPAAAVKPAGSAPTVPLPVGLRPSPLPSPPEPVLAPPRPTATAPQGSPGLTAPEPAAVSRPPAPSLIPAIPPRPVGTLTYQSALGFSFKHPADWRVQLIGGRIEVVAPASDSSGLPPAAAIIWPLARLRVGQDAATLGRTLLAQCEVGDGTAQLQARQAGNLSVLSGVVGQGEAAQRLVACCYVQRDHALLTAVMARPDEFQARLPSLLQILDSFAGGPWWIELGSEPARTASWHEPVQDRLRLPFPDDWSVQGLVRFVAGVPILSVELHSRDGQLSCLWRQPLAPMFRDLTPDLRNLGWQEGDRYPANARENQLRLMARLSPQDFLTRYWLREGPTRLEDATVDRLTVLAPVAGLAGATGSQGLLAELHGQVAGQQRQRVSLIATGDAPGAVGENCWQAAVLEAEAPAGALGDAVTVLRAAVEGATVGETTSPAEAGTLRGALVAARAAVAVLPSPPRPQANFAEVLTIRNTRGLGRLWLLPPQALAPWRQAAQGLREAKPPTDDHSPGAALPELAPD